MPCSPIRCPVLQPTWPLYFGLAPPSLPPANCVFLTQWDVCALLTTSRLSPSDLLLRTAMPVLPILSLCFQRLRARAAQTLRVRHQQHHHHTHACVHDSLTGCRPGQAGASSFISVDKWISGRDARRGGWCREHENVLERGTDVHCMGDRSCSSCFVKTVPRRRRAKAPCAACDGLKGSAPPSAGREGGGGRGLRSLRMWGCMCWGGKGLQQEGSGDRWSLSESGA